MNNRQKELLRILLVHEEGVLHIKDLSEELDCAEKTVRNDLDRLEEFLRDYPSARLIRKPGLGIAIESDESDRSEILRSLLSSEPKTNEERLFEMAYQLLTSDKAITLQHFADRYYVPKAAIKKDIEAITDWLERFELELVSKPRVGNVIQGSELKKRNALAHLSELFLHEKNVVLDLFLPYEISTVRNALKDMQGRFSIAFSDDALESLLVHALIMVKRTRQRSPVFVQESEKVMAFERKEYQFASWFFEKLELAFRLTFPDVEQVYFTWHLISSKRVGEELHQDLTVDEEAAELVLAFVRKMEKLTFIHYEADPILIDGLAVHLHSVINRIKYGFPITNPLLSNIKKMYPYMFNMVMLTLEEIKQTFHIEIPEDEAAYIVLHFQASVERLEKKRDIKKKALIVCHMGIGMSHLLEAKIEQQYQNIEIVACIGKAEVPEYLSSHPADFIISTVPLEKVTIEHIVISPLFGQEDKKKLHQFVEVLKQKSTEHHGPHVFSPFLKEELVFFHVEKEHRYEVVELLADALYKKGFVSKEYIHSAVNRERKSATAIGGGIAIPHGNPSMIHQSALATAIMKERMEWGNERVSLVIMLAIAKENQGELRGVIGKISALSEAPLVVHAVTAARDYQEFLQVLDQFA
ncbi:transcription antiterminator [Bacillus sp. ISL-40]|uniref:BglG family transcription antiterminator n=1 Tax=unclassified Bacillus (in: firmicutes) TaxID=185979 RepID=UPI001BECEE4B|nr:MULTISPECIES: BglG family transcription antiterminator [unclassified Bacillus (in: firmicutes)]MBT2695874.1 transcription antiterminator [Bacillus sp. ISL-40]MBT2739770.1 transcription antiterminator [Bacillus sp. ISL-77]